MLGVTPEETARHNRALALIAQVEPPSTELEPATEILEGEVLEPGYPGDRRFHPETSEFKNMGFTVKRVQFTREGFSQLASGLQIGVPRTTPKGEHPWEQEHHLGIEPGD